MIELNKIMDIALLEQMLEQGYVRVATHPKYPELKIYGYTQNAQFDSMWNSVTNVCRGLITATQFSISNGEEIEYVLARPFAKFHNVNTLSQPETMEENLPLEDPIFTTKLDGSMGIIYFWDGKIHVATRGSFDSEQARWATKWIREKNPGLTVNMYPGFTLVSEIIYAENLIVVNYNFEGMVGLGLISNQTGREEPYHMLEEACVLHGMDVVETHADKAIKTAMLENTRNAEGYVVTFPSTGLKIKLKFEEYCRLHRIITGLNPRGVWEKLSAGEDAELVAMINDVSLGEGFRTWLSKWRNQLLGDYNVIKNTVEEIYSARPQSNYQVVNQVPTGQVVTRKDLALYFTNSSNKEYSGLCFALEDGKNIIPLIWKRLRPVGGATFREEGEV